MPLLQALRQSKFIARCVLVWFALAMAAAVAAPVVNPQGTQLVCSTAGTVKLVNVGLEDFAAGADDSSPMQSHLLECVLCLAISAPPTPELHAGGSPQFLSFAPQGPPGAWIAKRTAAPLPARGPPSA
jgi:hypothetical protein